MVPILELRDRFESEAWENHMQEMEQIINQGDPGTADYQQAKDGAPDVDTCRECGAALEPDDGGWLCVTCEDMYSPIEREEI